MEETMLSPTWEHYFYWADSQIFLLKFKIKVKSSKKQYRVPTDYPSSIYQA